MALLLRTKNDIQGRIRGTTMKRYIATLLTVMMVGTTAGFAQTVDDHAKTKKGAVIGGVAGAIVGAAIGNNRGHHSAKRGAVVGAVAGTAARAIVGAMMDKQEREVPPTEGGHHTHTAPHEPQAAVRHQVPLGFKSAGPRT